MDFNKIKANFIARVKSNKKTRWVRFALVSLLFFAWVAWLGNWWVSLWWFLLFDIYITGYIPFSWWKNSKNKVVKSVMSWVDAIVYALILVYFIFAFVGQNYQIPSSSLEKTLLTGDYLWVNKMIYGPRVPMTPVNFPLVHNKLPFANCDSYLDWPSNEYHRLKGYRNVELGDIVVFNFPAGDTVVTRLEESPEYYYLLVNRFGRDYIEAHPEMFGEIKYRPVDRRQNFVKRCVGLPGETIKIANDIIYNNGIAQYQPKDVQFGYIITSDKPLHDELLHELGITASDVQDLTRQFDIEQKAYFAQVLPSVVTSSHIYALPLTEDMITSLKERGYLNEAVKTSKIMPVDGRTAMLFPQGVSDNWTLSNYGGENGLWIPKKGETIELTPENWAIYERCIRNYENHPEARLADDGKVYFGEQPTDKYTFTLDYYFMMGDNRDFSQDSRFWGFVPEDHIVGSPMLVLISFDRDRSIFNGSIRWNRIFRDANPDK